MKLHLVFIFLCVNLSLLSQTINYNDVAVIVNTNSLQSMDIAKYFQEARNIPYENLIFVDAPITEEIDSAGFEAIRLQIENYLINNDLVDSINYLVTTKDIPLKIESSCFNEMGSDFKCASFDSELTLILGTYSNSIGASSSIANPIYNSSDNFSRTNSSIYLVTRLDGYEVQDVFNLIDRSGPETGLNKTSSQAILDINTSVSGDSAYYSEFYIVPTFDFLNNDAWNVQVDPSVNVLQNQTNVFAYMYQGQDSISNAELNYTWTNGSIASMSTCESTNTFTSSLNPDNFYLVPDLIAEGCTGAHGIVNCIFFSQILNTEILMNRYLNSTIQYNLAESFYMAEPRLSWQSVIIGDPKSSIVIDNFASLNNQNNQDFSIYPNPSKGVLNVKSGDLITTIAVITLNGEEVLKNEDVMSHSTELDLEELPNGVYLIQLKTEASVFQKRIIINH